MLVVLLFSYVFMFFLLGFLVVVVVVVVVVPTSTFHQVQDLMSSVEWERLGSELRASQLGKAEHRSKEKSKEPSVPEQGGCNHPWDLTVYLPKWMDDFYGKQVGQYTIVPGILWFCGDESCHWAVVGCSQLWQMGKKPCFYQRHCSREKVLFFFSRWNSGENIPFVVLYGLMIINLISFLYIVVGPISRSSLQTSQTEQG